MKKAHLLILFFLVSVTAIRPLHAGIFWTIGYNIGLISPNTNLSQTTSTIRYLNGKLGYHFDFGLSIFGRYDHLDATDYIVNGNNVHLVAVLPAIGVGYSLAFFEEKLLLSGNVIIAYSPSVRYRLNITDYKISGFAYAASLELFYKIVGRFYIGLEAGYRYFIVTIPTAPSFLLDLGGFIGGIGIRHQY